MQKTHNDNDELKLRFSVSQGSSMAAVDNVTQSWGELVKKLSRSYEDPMTLAQFKEKPKDWQNTRKQRNGYFIGGQMKGHARAQATMRERQILTFDIDQGNTELLRDLREGKTGLGPCEYLVHSTRTHGDGAVKLRLIVPLAKLLPKEDFQAVARVAAWNLDCNMVVVDPVSFVPAQIMYWPAHCSGVKPILIRHRGPLLDVYAMLEDWGGGPDVWRDIGMLPVSARDDARLHMRSGKMHQNPLDKRGPVGAFCRTWSVHEAIDEFLSDVYEPSEYSASGEPSRYSYTQGTSANGLVVFDSGHVESYHGSDPLSQMNVNAFDMVRIHKFGHLDGVRDEDEKDPRQLRSFKAMETMLLEYPDYVQELRDGYYGLSPDEIDDSFEAGDTDAAKTEVTSAIETPKVVDDPEWEAKLDINEKGTVKNTLTNLILILRNGRLLKGRFGYNEHRHVDCLVKRFRSIALRFDHKIPAGETFTTIDDAHIASIRSLLEAPRGKNNTGWGLRVSERDLKDALTVVCREASFHPVRDYLDTLVWDGKSRIEHLWTRACHTPDTPYYRMTSHHFLVAAVARVYEPGTKFDFMPVLIGPQGIRKSTLVMTIGSSAWTTESEGHFDDKKKFVEASLGFWFIEHGEMTHFRRASDEEGIKAMLSGTADTVRLSYRRNPETIRRDFVIVGTTNDWAFLRTTHRRIWPIPCEGRIDLEWAAANRDQLFAEAVQEYRRMRRESNSGFLPLYLTGEADDEHQRRQAEHLLPDDSAAKAGIVADYLDALVPFSQSKPGWSGEDATDAAITDEDTVRRTYTCAVDIFVRALGGDFSKYDRRAAQNVGEIMRNLEPEWRAGVKARCGRWGIQRTYRRNGIDL